MPPSNAQMGRDLSFDGADSYVEFCRKGFRARSLFRFSPHAGPLWITAWKEHMRYVSKGLAIPFFLAHDALLILAGPGGKMRPQSGCAYSDMMRAVASFVRNYELKNGFLEKGENGRGKMMAFRPFLRELVLACDVESLGAIRLPDPGRAEKYPIEKEDPSVWTACDSDKGCDETSWEGLFAENRLSFVLEKAPELLERCLGLFRYEKRLEEEQARFARHGRGRSGVALPSASFGVAGPNRQGFRRAMWSIASDFGLMADYREGIGYPPKETVHAYFGKFTCPLVGKQESRGSENRTLGLGPPPGHPVSFGAPKPLVSIRMAENKVPAYRDFEIDREPVLTSVVLVLDLVSARKARGGLAWGLAGALKLAAFLSLSDLLLGFSPESRKNLEAALMVCDIDWGDAGGFAPHGLSQSVRITPIFGKGPVLSQENRVLFFNEGAFPMLFNHAPGWAFSEGSAENGEHFKGMMESLTGYWGDRQAPSRKVAVFMGGPGFAVAFSKYVRDGGSQLFRFVRKNADAVVAEAEPGKGGARPRMFFGYLDQALSFGGEQGEQVFPYRGFRGFVCKRVLSPKSL